MFPLLGCLYGGYIDRGRGRARGWIRTGRGARCPAVRIAPGFIEKGALSGRGAFRGIFQRWKARAGEKRLFRTVTAGTAGGGFTV